MMMDELLRKCVGEKALRDDEIRSLKEYLTSTDYVVSKLNELKLEDDETEYVKAKTEYADVLKKRKEARARINELEAETE